MKRTNILALLVAAISASLAFTACLKDQEDLFEESASARMQATLENTQKILESKSNGWVMFVYPKTPSTEAMNIGYVYTVKFSDNKVTARSERDGQGATEVESYYRMTNDEGPVLSFDQGNSILHYWSTPGGSSSQYEGRGGDFEFNVMKAEDNYVKLVGKRYRVTYELFPLEKDAETFITESIANKQSGDDYFGVYAGSVKGDAEIYSPSASYQIFWMGWEETDEETGEVVEQEFQTPFVVLPDRIRLYEPATIGGETFQEIVYDNEAMTATALDNSNVTFGHPSTYLTADQIAGSYTLTYGPDGEEATIDVTLVKEVDEEGYTTFRMKGLNENWDVVMDYDDWWGELDLRVQSLGQVETNQNGFARLCFADLSYFDWGLLTTAWPYSSTTNFIYNLSGTYYNNAYYTIVWDDGDAAKPTLAIQYSGYARSSRLYESWYLHCYSNETGTTSRNALELESGWGFKVPGVSKPTEDQPSVDTTTSVMLPYPKSLTKK